MREFEPLPNVESIDEFIARHPCVLLYVSQPDCRVCHALQPKIQRLMMKYPKIALGAINAQEVKEVSGKFLVFTVPVALLFVEGKEYLREVRIVHMDLFDEKISRIYHNLIFSDGE